MRKDGLVGKAKVEKSTRFAFWINRICRQVFPGIAIFYHLTRIGQNPLITAVILVGVWSCTSHKEGSEIDKLPIYQTDQFRLIPGEKLEYQANAGVFNVGNLTLSVLEKMEGCGGKVCAHIQAKAATRSGISWLSQIHHAWDSWIDTSSGLSKRMLRNVQENKYHAEQELWFFPDSNLIVQTELHKSGKPQKNFDSQPYRMIDLVNAIWKIRYTPFEDHVKGDTLQYASFFDGEWLVMKLRFGGSGVLKSKGKRVDCFVLYPLGISSKFLRGQEPSEIWIEKATARRPLRVKVSTYFGNLSIDLKNSL